MKHVEAQTYQAIKFLVGLMVAAFDVNFGSATTAADTIEGRLETMISYLPKRGGLRTYAAQFP